MMCALRTGVALCVLLLVPAGNLFAQVNWWGYRPSRFAAGPGDYAWRSKKLADASVPPWADWGAVDHGEAEPLLFSGENDVVKGGAIGLVVGLVCLLWERIRSRKKRRERKEPVGVLYPAGRQRPKVTVIEVTCASRRWVEVSRDASRGGEWQ